MNTGLNLKSRFQSDSAVLRSSALQTSRTTSGRHLPAWEARKTVLQSRLEELLVFEINRDGHREYRSMVRGCTAMCAHVLCKTCGIRPDAWFGYCWTCPIALQHNCLSQFALTLDDLVSHFHLIVCLSFCFPCRRYASFTTTSSRPSPPNRSISNQEWS
jgi:hypothetical protein